MKRAALLLFLLAGCANPCADLAERTCKRTGAGDPLCTKLQAVAQSPTADEVEQCKAGNAFVDELERR